MASSKPSFIYEREWWGAGYELVAGIDEVGRGALAGPLVAAAVVLPQVGRTVPAALRHLADSKLLHPAMRESVCEEIVGRARALGIGLVTAAEIDEIGLAAANRVAMERAVMTLAMEPEVLLLDAMVTDASQPQVGLIDGDAICASIAAASIVAKVTRDHLMAQLHLTDERYGFAEHKGYGTKRHLAALQSFGPCSEHRRCFTPVSALGGFD